MASHPGWGGNSLLGTPGFTVPDMNGARRLDLANETIEAAKSAGIAIAGNLGNNNVVFFP